MYVGNQASGHSPLPIAHLRHRAALSRDDTRAERGGDPPRYRSRDTSLIGGEMRALGLLLPYAVEGT